MRISSKIGLALLVAGPLAILSCYSWIETRNLTPLISPLPLIPGHYKYSFRTNVQDLHEVDVVVHAPRVTHGMACAVGVEIGVTGGLENCPDNSPELEVSWLIADNGAEIASYQSDGSAVGYHASPTELMRSLGSFDPPRRGQYQLEVFVTKSGPTLRQYRAYLEIAVTSMYSEESALVFLGVSVIAVICTIIGATLTIVGHFTRNSASDDNNGVRKRTGGQE